MAGVLNLFRGRHQPPSDQTRALVAAEQRARIELERRIDELANGYRATLDQLASQLDQQQQAHAAALEALASQVAQQQQHHAAEIGRLASQLDQQQLAHATEIERLARAYQTDRDQLLDRVSKQDGYIEYMRRAAEHATASAVSQHEAIGALTKGLMAAEERLTRQRVISDGRHERMIKQVERAAGDMRYLLKEFALVDPSRLDALLKVISIEPPAVERYPDEEHSDAPAPER